MKPKEKQDAIISDYCLLTQVNYCISKVCISVLALASHLSYIQTNICWEKKSCVVWFDSDSLSENPLYFQK